MNFFLSYSSQNAEFVTRLWEAEIAAIETNLKETAGLDIMDTLDRVLPNIDYIIVVLSRAYNQDTWLESELMAFVGKEKSAGHKLLMPIVIDDCHVPYIIEKRVCADFRESFEKGLNDLLEYISEMRRVFVVMKFNDEELESAFETIVATAESYSYSVLRIDKIQNSEYIPVQILREIARSQIIIADLTHDSPNCYYEVGYAHALGKELVLTRRTEENIPFDLAGNRFIIWKTEKDLREKLKARLDAIRARGR